MKSFRMNKIHETKKIVNEKKVFGWRVYELKIVQKEKQPSNDFLTKPNEKCAQLNKKVVLLDSNCAWLNVNEGYGNVTIQI